MFNGSNKAKKYHEQNHDRQTQYFIKTKFDNIKHRALTSDYDKI